MVGIILAAGDGKRLKNSKNEDCCKPLVKVNEKNLIDYALDNLIQLEISEAYVVIGKEGDLIKSTLGNEYKNIRLHYVCQYEQKGLINAFLQALSVMENDEAVVLQLSDEIFVDLKSEQIKSMIKDEKADFYCGVTPEDNPQKIKNNFSVETDSNLFLIKCTEKPQVVIDNIKGTGFSIFNHKTIKVIKDTYKTKPEKLFDLCDSFNYLVSSGYKGLTFPVAEREFNINTLSDFSEAEECLK